MNRVAAWVFDTFIRPGIHQMVQDTIPDVIARATKIERERCAKMLIILSSNWSDHGRAVAVSLSSALLDEDAHE